MARLDIELPDDLRAKAEARAAEFGHPSLQVYVESLVREDAETERGAPPHLHVSSQEQLVSLLREGQASPGRAMEPSDWDALRRRLVERAQPKGP